MRIRSLCLVVFAMLAARDASAAPIMWVFSGHAQINYEAPGFDTGRDSGPFTLTVSFDPDEIGFAYGGTTTVAYTAAVRFIWDGHADAMGTPAEISTNVWTSRLDMTPHFPPNGYFGLRFFAMSPEASRSEPYVGFLFVHDPEVLSGRLPRDPSDATAGPLQLYWGNDGRNFGALARGGGPVTSITAVPEPSALALAVFAAFGFIARRRVGVIDAHQRGVGLTRADSTSRRSGR